MVREFFSDELSDEAKSAACLRLCFHAFSSVRLDQTYMAGERRTGEQSTVKFA